MTHFSRRLLLVPLAALLWLASCAKDIQNSEAVRQGVLDYLKARAKETGLDMNSMDVKVTSVSFEKDLARASVSFIPKGMPSGAGMSMNYVLDRKGDKWTVRGRQTNPASPHGVMPSGGAPAEGQPTPGGQLPGEHPPVENKQ